VNMCLNEITHRIFFSDDWFNRKHACVSCAFGIHRSFTS